MTTSPSAALNENETKPFILALFLNLIWINVSEVFRYFVFVMPMMREAFAFVPDIAPMDVSVFLVWGVWDTILVLSVTSIAWLALDRLGLSQKHIVIIATGIWATVFVILWLGLFNMNLATPAIVLTALPLAWLEMYVAVWLVRFAKTRYLGDT